jgi:DNA-binding CsgD family transcriptional regulator
MLDRPHQRAQAAGWIARAQRLVDEAKEPCVEQGWLLCATARQRAATGDSAGAYEAFQQATGIAVRFADRDLIALSRHGQGRALLMLNRPSEGLALLDEVMVAVTSGEIRPLIAGTVYCSVITACHDRFDLHRAQEWTTALQSWCAAQPGLIAFRGYCSIRRSELMQLHGAWGEALSEATLTCERLTPGSMPPEAGAAYYQLAELYRLRGEYGKAEDTYRLASQAGGKTQPGLALLRLSQGQIESADASIRVALKEPRDGRARVLLLAAAIEIMLAANDRGAAHEASNELAQLAARLDLPFPSAVSAQARGAVALANGEPLAALEWLRAARTVWQELNAPYDVAQTRVLMGLAYRQLGDHEGAHLEFDAAHEVLEKLGAVAATNRLADLSAAPQPAGSTGLTGREIEVLRLIATGVTNRIIAERLQISEKTVARHISNIFTKLDLPSRAAATAYAYEHKLL